MRYHQLKNMRISTLGLGGIRYPTEEGNPDRFDREKGRELIKAAFNRGINYFDTAHIYKNGESEALLGEILSEYPRDSYYLADKFHVGYCTDIEAMFEEQLKRCKVDYFDFYMLHSLDEKNIEKYMDPELDLLGFILREKEKGRIRNIGFSSHAGPETLKRVLEWYDGFDMALIQLNYLDWTLLHAKEQYEILTAHNIPVWAMEPQKGGKLAVLNEEAAAILKAAAPERSIASWGFRFLQSLPNLKTMLSGMATLEQIEDNANTFDVYDPLSEEELKILEQAAAVYRRDMGVPCSTCRYCCETCPAGLDIPLLIQGYNELKISGGTWKVPGYSQTKKASECLQCGVCAEHCPQKIAIPQILQELTEMEKKK